MLDLISDDPLFQNWFFPNPSLIHLGFFFPSVGQWTRLFSSLVHLNLSSHWFIDCSMVCHIGCYSCFACTFSPKRAPFTQLRCSLNDKVAQSTRWPPLAWFNILVWIKTTTTLLQVWLSVIKFNVFVLHFSCVNLQSLISSARALEIIVERFYFQKQVFLC